MPADPAETTTGRVEEASTACPLRGCRSIVVMTEYPDTDRLPTCAGRCDLGAMLSKRNAGQTCRGAASLWRRVARARGLFAGATSADLRGSDEDASRDVAAWRATRADW